MCFFAKIQPIIQVKIYLDGSAKVRGFKEIHHKCKFLLSPYDSSTQKPKDLKWDLATTSKPKCRDCYMAWKDNSFSYADHSASKKLDDIYTVIGNDTQERRDGLHLDSAYKSVAHIFLTSTYA